MRSEALGVKEVRREALGVRSEETAGVTPHSPKATPHASRLTPHSPRAAPHPLPAAGDPSRLTPHALLVLSGKPFRQRGRGPDGFDCWGLVIWVRRLGGLTTPDYDIHYADVPGVAEAVDTVKAEAWFEPVTGSPACFDVVEFKPGESGELHFGVMIDRVTFLDVTDDGAGVKPNRIDNPWNSTRIAGYWRRDQ